MYRRGISPVIATVILVAVAVAVSIAVAGWLMGLWGTFGAVEQLQIMPDSTLNATDGTLTLHVKNTGTKAAVITKVEIAGVEATSASQTVAQGNSTIITLTFTSTDKITPGASYLIKVYTSSGAVYQGYVVASG